MDQIPEWAPLKPGEALSKLNSADVYTRENSFSFLRLEQEKEPNRWVLGNAPNPVQTRQKKQIVWQIFAFQNFKQRMEIH